MKNILRTIGFVFSHITVFMAGGIGALDRENPQAERALTVYAITSAVFFALAYITRHKESKAL